MIPIGVGSAFYAVRRFGAVPLSLLGLLEPIVGVLAASILLAERLTPAQWTGMAVILVACGALPWATSSKRQVAAISAAEASLRDDYGDGTTTTRIGEHNGTAECRG